VNVRYGARPPVERVDHEVDATTAPIATEAVTVTYLTDPDVIAAVLPRPLEPAAEPVVRVSLQRVVMPGRPAFGSGVFSVAARHGAVQGEYPLFMPQSTEQSVIGGRETFGEPKKLGDISVERTGDDVVATISRLGFPLVSVRGSVTGPAASPPHGEAIEFYFKFLRAPDGNGITDPHLVYGRYNRHYEIWEAMDAVVELGDSPLDPVADLAIRKVTSVTWCRRRTRQTAEIVQRVPQEWLLPFVHQRYDDIALLDARPQPATV
jgi:acetoacetate decarboxylase